MLTTNKLKLLLVIILSHTGLSVQRTQRNIVNMSLEQSAQTPYHQQNPQEEQEISAAERALIDQAIILSLQESQLKGHRKSEGLKTKYRKMIVNLKMGKSSQKCTVCFDSFVEGQIIKRLPCGHIFHRQCAKSWLKLNKTCPICRSDIEHFFIRQQKQGDTQYMAMCDKKIKINSKTKTN